MHNKSYISTKFDKNSMNHTSFGPSFSVLIKLLFKQCDQAFQLSENKITSESINQFA